MSSSANVTGRDGSSRPRPAPGVSFESVTRPLLSVEVRRQLLERILDGRLAAATRLAEAELARQLGVSRTPLHEAMVSLSRDGLVAPLGKRGWMVCPLSATEARELFPVAGALEGLIVLQRSVTLGIDDLLAASGRLEGSARASSRRFEEESEWHRLLLEACSNATLVELARPVLTRARRYEKLCLHGGWRISPGELPGVAACLLRGDARAAARALEIHWRDRGESVAVWLAGAAPAVA